MNKHLLWSTTNEAMVVGDLVILPLIRQVDVSTKTKRPIGWGAL